MTPLRKVYSEYSRLGSSLVENSEHSEDFTFVMLRLQFWRFLKDSGIHLRFDAGEHVCTLLHVDRIIGVPDCNFISNDGFDVIFKI